MKSNLKATSLIDLKVQNSIQFSVTSIDLSLNGSRRTAGEPSTRGGCTLGTPRQKECDEQPMSLYIICCRIKVRTRGACRQREQIILSRETSFAECTVRSFYEGRYMYVFGN